MTDGFLRKNRPFDIGAEGSQLSHVILVASIDMGYLVYMGFAFGGNPR